MLSVYLIFTAVMSFITAIAFGIDKLRSKKENRKRIPESVLLSLVAFGGSPGGLFGMYTFRHKTIFFEKFHFALGVWFSFIVQVALAVFIHLYGNGKITFR